MGHNARPDAILLVLAVLDDALATPADRQAGWASVGS